jgi:outer membrane protein OmpA-like peptidoglycan-associated protein
MSAGHRRRVVVVLITGAFAAACSARPEESQRAEHSQTVTAKSASSPAAAATQSSDSNPLGASVGAVDPENGPPESWALEPPPADWRTHASTDIPVVAGLTEVVAVQEPQGDYESVGTVESVTPETVSYLFSVRSGSLNGVTSNRARRIVARRDIEDAHAYRMTFASADPESFPGQTAVGISSAVFRELYDHGRSRIDLYASTDVAAAVATILSAFGAGSSDLNGELARVESELVGVPVLVNGRRVWLPALHAKGDFKRIDDVVRAEFWFLADARNPMTLRAAVDRVRLQVVRIDVPAAETASALERALANSQPVEIWGVYFESGSAQLQPESDSVLDQVAAVLRRHPEWRLRIEGHTDDVGNESDNLSLSRQRAEAVRGALVRRLGQDGGQLEAAGYGKSRPRESNATLSGRARNRRVELTRQ